MFIGNIVINFTGSAAHFVYMHNGVQRFSVLKLLNDIPAVPQFLRNAADCPLIAEHGCVQDLGLDKILENVASLG